MAMTQNISPATGNNASVLPDSMPSGLAENKVQASSVLRLLLRAELKWVVPVLGGLGVMAHFWRIGYAPSLSLGDMGTVLAAFVMFSIYALLLILLTTLAPTAMFGYWIERHVLPPPSKVSPTAREKRHSLRSLRQPSSVGILQYDARRIFVPPGDNAGRFLIELMAGALTALAIYVWLVPRMRACTNAYEIGFWVLFFFGMVIVAFGFSFPEWSWVRHRMIILRRRWMRVLLLFVLYLAFWPALIALTLGVAPGILDEAGWLYSLMAIGLLLATHFFIYASYRKAGYHRILIAAGGLMMMLVYSQLPLSMVDGAVDRFGLGMMRNVDLVVTEDACKIVSATLPALTCTPVEATSGGAHRLGKVDVFTRIGPHFLIGTPGSLRDQTKTRVVLSANKVLSWSRALKVPSRKQNCSRK